MTQPKKADALLVRRSTSRLLAFLHPGDQRWHSDTTDATQSVLDAAATCGAVVTVHQPTFKPAVAVEAASLCAACWDVVPAPPACEACGVELDKKGACWWCDGEPVPTVDPDAFGAAGYLLLPPSDPIGGSSLEEVRSVLRATVDLNGPAPEAPVTLTAPVVWMILTAFTNVEALAAEYEAGRSDAGIDVSRAIRSGLRGERPAPAPVVGAPAEEDLIHTDWNEEKARAHLASLREDVSKLDAVYTAFQHATVEARRNVEHRRSQVAYSENMFANPMRDKGSNDE